MQVHYEYMIKPHQYNTQQQHEHIYGIYCLDTSNTPLAGRQDRFLWFIYSDYKHLFPPMMAWAYIELSWNTFYGRSIFSIPYIWHSIVLGKYSTPVQPTMARHFMQHSILERVGRTGPASVSMLSGQLFWYTPFATFQRYIGLKRSRKRRSVKKMVFRQGKQRHNYRYQHK